MASRTQTSRIDNHSAYTRILNNRQYRLTLYQLLEHGPLSEQTLARRLAASQWMRPRGKDELSESAQSSVLMQLRHRILPQLASVGWITRCSGRVAIDTTVSLDPLDISATALRKPDDPAWEAEAAILGQPYLKSVVTITATTTLPLTLDELVSELQARGNLGEYTPPKLRMRLHHIDLPKLDDVDVLSYSADRRAITADGPVVPFQSEEVTINAKKE